MVKYEYDGPRESASVSRRFGAPATRVFDAWIEPETASKWWFTTKTSESVCELDPRVGGSYKVTRTRGGKQYVAIGEYIEVQRPRRLVFTFGMPQFAADFDTVTVEIENDKDGCKVNLTQDGLRPGYATSTVNGWNKMFDLLDAALK